MVRPGHQPESLCGVSRRVAAKPQGPNQEAEAAPMAVWATANMTALNKQCGAAMTKAYIVGQLTITNAEGYAKYSAVVPGTIQAHGGKDLVRGGQVSQLEGVSQGDRRVVIEFPSRQAAEVWYESPEYQAILPHRQANSVGHIALVDGLALG